VAMLEVMFVEVVPPVAKIASKLRLAVVVAVAVAVQPSPSSSLWPSWVEEVVAVVAVAVQARPRLRPRGRAVAVQPYV